MDDPRAADPADGAEGDARPGAESDPARAPRLPAHLYIHVPFCARKCAYCDFRSAPPAGPGEVARWAGSMVREADRTAAVGLPGRLETVYFGGGTPSLVLDEVLGVLAAVRDRLEVADDAEVTLEANPESLDSAGAGRAVAAGVTRISVGVQSLDEGMLALLGRGHDSSRAVQACGWVRDAGADLAIDLICGIPGQTMSSWRDTLARAIDERPMHVSVYPLTVEEGTPLATAVGRGQVPAPDPDAAADMMIAAADILGAAGLPRYEVANQARPGHESRHNSAYWLGRSYLGWGPGAHGMLDPVTATALGVVVEPPAGTARVRYAFDIPADIETLTSVETAREDVMLGLRLVTGVPDGLVKRAGLETALEELRRDGLVESRAGRWTATRRGWLLGNEVFGRVWAG